MQQKFSKNYERIQKNSTYEACLKQLQNINQEAIEENYPEISDESIALAKSILYKLCDFSIDPAVYPSMYGDVSIYFKSQSKPAAVLVRVVSDQCVVCHSSINGENKEKIYNEPSEIPDEFMKNQLQALL